MIDAHVHLWQLGQNGCTWPTPDLQPIYRDFVLGDFLANAAEVEGVVLVQTQEDPADTAWLLRVAEDPIVRGVVGWADLEQPETIPHHPKLKGLRPMVQGREAGWYDRPEIAPGLAAMERADLVLDALIRPRHLPALTRLAARHPDLRIVIDHAAKPDVTDLRQWAVEMEMLAAFPNVACKLSGLLTELAPSVEPLAIRPAFETLWRNFGADRLLWGSDWPVITLASTYSEWLTLARGLVPAPHRRAVFGANAGRVYDLAR